MEEINLDQYNNNYKGGGGAILIQARYSYTQYYNEYMYTYTTCNYVHVQ